MTLCADSNNCTRRALLMGTFHTDIDKMKKCLEDCFGFNPDDITILRSAPLKHASDSAGRQERSTVLLTKETMLVEFKRLVESVRAEDIVFVYYSGRGGHDADYDYLVPREKKVDDHDLSEYLVKDLNPEAKLVLFLDATNSGNVLHLKHHYSAADLLLTAAAAHGSHQRTPAINTNGEFTVANT